MDRNDPAYRGQADYTPLLLRLYDPIVLGPVIRYVWGCPRSRLIEVYRSNIRPRHLDVGPGTGWFLDHAGFPADARITILDPNRHVLDMVSHRLQRFDPELVEADVLKPLPVTGPFDSAALAAVIHCLPGPTERKARAVANVAATLAPDGVLFGGSVLGSAGPHTRLSRQVLRAFNRRGAFDNLDDSLDSLHSMLDAEFAEVELETLGTVALFRATRPFRPASPTLG